MPKDVSRLSANKADGVAVDQGKGPAGNRVKGKEPIPLNKTPKRQRSSRFHIAERVELEKLVGFNGEEPSHVRALIGDLVLLMVVMLSARRAKFGSILSQMSDQVTATICC